MALEAPRQQPQKVGRPPRNRRIVKAIYSSAALPCLHCPPMPRKVSPNAA